MREVDEAAAAVEVVTMMGIAVRVVIVEGCLEIEIAAAAVVVVVDSFYWWCFQH